MNKKIFLILLIFLEFSAQTIFASEATIKILDKDTKKPLPFANICIEELNTAKKYFEITPENGTINNLVKEKAKISISFIGYKTLRDTIMPNESKTYYLEPDLFDVEQVVVTGDIKPTSKDKSIYVVKTISAKDVEEVGAVNMSDVLMTQPNIRIKTDGVLGTQIEMMGMDGENVKTMIDGVPVIGRLSGNVDLSQVNTANIDHIEIIEGPMSVIYGNNALAGTINIITKKGYKNKPVARLGTQAESAGKFAGNIFYSKPFGDNNNQSLAFNGFASYFNGIDYDKATRSQDWRPKTNCQAGIQYDWANNNWNINAKVNGYYGQLLIKDDISQNGSSYVAYDKYYYTHRFDGSVQAIGKWKENNHLNILACYNYYDRASQECDKNLTTLEDTWLSKEYSQDFQYKELRAIYSHLFTDINMELQTGIDLKMENMGGPRLDSTSYEEMGDYAAFLNIKYKITDKIEIQPGARYAYNTAFNHPLVYSVNLKYAITPKIHWRVSAAKGFRSPSLKELYYNFVNSSHDIHGNPDLKAEYSKYYSTSFSIKPVSEIKVTLSGFYNHLHNKIELVSDASVTSHATYYNYQNIDEYKSLGGNLTMLYAPNKNIKLNFGGTITGRYNDFSDYDKEAVFKYSPDLSLGVNILEPHTDIRCRIDYKYNGKIPYLYDDDDTIKDGEQEAYNILNFSLNRSFFKRHLHTSLGVRNLFDVDSIKTTNDSSGHGVSTSKMITYGRSYYIQLSYIF